MRKIFCKKLIPIILCSAGLVSGCDAVTEESGTQGYISPFISDLKTSHAFTKTIPGHRMKIRVSLFYQSNGMMPISHLKAVHSESNVKHVVSNSSRLMSSYLRGRKIPDGDCRGLTYNVNIFVVSKEVMMQDYRFKGFIQRRFGVSGFHGTAYNGMWLHGYYTSTPEIANESTILVTDLSSVSLSKSYNEEVLAHEIGHYLWDRLCVAAYTKEDPEFFATDFQNYYNRKNK